ncbi:hypothetical protein DVZ84_02990 [Streptomyces parvulus]|uniref:Uncharacterized protein n=1 Tax=Streptomyces parvulus TaxID=146923 RepID=A0A369VER8_9ACTN|nr:hypothetical protein DVZ84_02990 [Streptomyces parvulus]
MIVRGEWGTHGQRACAVHPFMTVLMPRLLTAGCIFARLSNLDTARVQGLAVSFSICMTW